MYISKLVLKGYKRLFLGHINKLEFTPTQRINLIVGANGSGKSSLVKELSPLPANIKKDYEEDGYKEIHIKHNSSNYILTSGKTSTNKHTFLKDDLELNPAGTKKIQLLLVKEHFLLTPNIHEVLLNLKSFTTMSVLDRKNWLTNISTVDYTYALNIFNKLKQRNRDITGALKITQNEVSKNNNLILNTKEENMLRDEHLEIKEIISTLLSSKVSVDNNGIDNISNIIDETNSLLKNINKPTCLDKLSPDSYVNINESYKKDLYKRKSNIESVLKDLMFIEDTETHDNIDVNNEKIKHIQSELNSIKNSIYVDIDLNVIKDIYNMFIYINTKLNDILISIVEHTVDEYNIDNYKEDMNNLSNINNKLLKDKELLNKLISDKTNMEYLRDNKEVECNKCGNIWSVGFKLSDYNYISGKIEKLITNIETTEKEIKIITERSEFFKNKLDKIKEVKDIFSDSSLKLLEPIFKYVLDNSDIVNNTNSAIDILFKLKHDLEQWLKYEIHLTTYDNLLKDKNIIEEKRNIELKHFNANKDKLENELFTINQDIKIITSNIDSVKRYKIILTALKTNSNILIKFLKGSKKKYINDVKDLKNNSINECISILNLELSKIEHKLNESSYNKRLLDNSKDKIKTLNEQKKATDLLIDGMSPSNGLIAKSITHFLNIFTNDMNEIINSIWNYSIEILPCNITEDDLDYKFEVKVDNREIIEDVSKTSSSMKEVIDLAFKIVSMKYLGMDDNNLILDEFAATMDNHHANKAHDVIHSLSDSSFNQIFIISHYENIYTRFKNSDISVLNSENLVLNKELEINRVLKLS